MLLDFHHSSSSKFSKKKFYFASVSTKKVRPALPKDQNWILLGEHCDFIRACSMDSITFPNTIGNSVFLALTLNFYPVSYIAAYATLLETQIICAKHAVCIMEMT